MSSYNVKDLAEYMRRAKDKKQPFVLFTGAGCSKSAGIPLASELVDEINEKFALDLKPLSKEEKLDYGKCMSSITKDDRRTLLQSYIEKAKINWTHIVQALLIEKGYVQRVLTFNFDNILYRSCGLLGLYPSIYDFTSANLDLQSLIVDPAIVHLHGQSYGFIQLNAEEETRLHAKQLGQFVADTLNRSPSIFVGYSGQADAFFPLLKEKFSDRQKLFWVGRDEQIPNHVKDNLIGSKNVAHYLHHEDADRFFIELAQELECFPPKAFDDPFGHLLDELEAVLDFPIQEQSELDVLKSTRSLLKKAQSEMNLNARPNFQTLFLEGKYKESIALAKDKDLNSDEKEFVAWAEIMLGNQLLSEAIKFKKSELFSQSFEKYEAALAIKPDNHGALNNWGNALSSLARLEQAPELFKQSFEKYEAALAIRPEKHETLYNWGNALSDLARLEQKPERFCQSFEKYEAALAIKPDRHEVFNNWGVGLSDLAILEQKPERFNQSFEKFETALAIKPDYHEALYNWGRALLELAGLEQAPERFKQSFEKYEAALAIKPDKYEALNNWGNALSNLARLEQAPERFKQSFEKYEAALAIKPDNYDALYNWGAALSDLAELEQAPERFEQSFEKYEAALTIKPDNHKALNNWGIALSGLARLEQKPERFKQSFEKYEAALAIKPHKYEALFNWGSVLLDLAMLEQKPELFRQSFEKYEAALAIKPDSHEALYNWGRALLELARLEKKPALLADAKSTLIQSRSLSKLPNYNLACVFALLQDEANCKNELLACKANLTLPDRAHLNVDSDLDYIRGRSWFKDLLGS